MPFLGVVSIGGRIEHFVERVVAGRNQADGGETGKDADPEIPRIDSTDRAKGDDDSGNDEDVLEPVVGTRDADVRPEVQSSATLAHVPERCFAAS